MEVKKHTKIWILMHVLVLVIVLVVSFCLFYAVKNHHVKSESSSSRLYENYDMVHFNLVHGKTHMNYTRYYIGDYLKLLSDENFSFDRKTLFYVHGWIEDFQSESSETIANAYIQRGDHNIIIIDWGQYSFGFYISVIPRFTQIAKTFAKIMLDYFELGLDIEKVHCVGHSFGSHIMGIMARELYKISMGKYKIKRISALDPAHFGFFPSPKLENPLSSSDAEFVDAIHSDINFIGTPHRIGHVDFYPNGGNLQPGCPTIKFNNYMQLVNSFCSHQHAWRYWAETVKPGNEKIFPAVLCKDYKDFIDGKCNKNPINFMGYGVTPSVNGIFYNKLKSNVNFTVDDSYYLYIATSVNYRSDLIPIVTRLWQFFTRLIRGK